MKLVIAVMAITITTEALINLASTAACPSTNAPTMLTVCPRLLGNLNPLSLKSSNTIIIANTSIIVGNGTPIREAIKLNNNFCGIIS